MAMTFLTNLKFEPKGTHNPAQAYSVMDVVISADGSIAYAAVKDVPAGTALSSNGGYWVKLLDLSALKDGIPAEKIEEAVNAYLEENPVSGGATQEQAAQIEQNKQDIADLKENGVGEAGEDGGYYIPSVSFESGDELNDYLNVEFAPSKADMPPVLSEMIPMRKAKNGATFTPSVDAEGNLSWTNDGGYANPEEVNIKGPKGDPGSDANVTAVSIRTALGYTPADQADIDAVEQEILITPGTMAEQAVDVYKDTSHTWEDGLYINYVNGSTASSASYYGCADYFEIPEGGRLFANYTNTALYYPTLAFYDANKTYISGEYPRLSSVDERNEYNGLYGYLYQVPANARYFRFSVQTGMKGILKMYLISDVVVGGKVEIPNLAGAKSRIDGKKVVCFGDSLFGMYRGEDSAPAFIAAETGATVYNVGFGGCRMAVHPTSGYGAFSMWALAKAIAEKNWTTQDAQASSGSSYFPDQLALLKSIDFNTVDIAVIHYGTNDFASGNGVPVDNASDPDDYNSLCGALRYSLDKLLGAYPKLRIYISLPVYRFWTDNGATTYAETYLNKIGKTLPEFVEALRGVAAEYNLPVIDGYYGLGINKANAATFLSDGTHHNATGRERFGRFIGENLIAQQGSAKAGMDAAAINALIENAIGSAIGGAY